MIQPGSDIGFHNVEMRIGNRGAVDIVPDIQVLGNFAPAFQFLHDLRNVFPR